jgi:zinc transporter 1/2/3
MMRLFPLTPLHYKGISTLGLLWIAESIAVTNAVKLWGRNDRFETFSSAICVDDSSSTTCPAAAKSPRTRSRGQTVLGKLTRRFGCGTSDCCLDCSHCTKEALSKCRGGAAAADALAEAASKVMPYNIPLNGWKVIFQAFLTTLNVLCWLIPLRSKKISENKLALSLANAFSGGVFLSLAFGHLIPECAHMFEGYNEVTPYMLVLSGYLLIFFVEKVAFDAHEIMHEMEHAQDNKVNGDGDSNGVSGGRSAVILLGALAVHSVLEMTALGLADTFGDSAILTLSIALHQVRAMSCCCTVSYIS